MAFTNDLNMYNVRIGSLKFAVNNVISRLIDFILFRQYVPGFLVTPVFTVLHGCIDVDLPFQIAAQQAVQEMQPVILVVLPEVSQYQNYINPLDKP